MMMTDMSGIIAHYVSLRDKKSEIEARHKEELAPLESDMQMIEGALLVAMQDQNVTSLKTAAGTAFKSEAVSVKSTDWEATLGAIIERQEWSLLEARVNKTAYMAMVEEGKEVPGVEVKKAVKVNIRRATGA